MRKVWTYWSHIAKLALKVTGGEIWKRFLGFAILVIAVTILGLFFGPLIGIDRLLVAGLAVLAPAALFVCKLLAIPAELHERQLSRKQIEAIAKKLDKLWEDGRDLHAAGLLRVTASENWEPSVAAWEKSVLSELERYDKAERFMFDTVDYEAKMRALALAPIEARISKVKTLLAQMNKLRLIVGRAYSRARGVDYVADSED